MSGDSQPIMSFQCSEPVNESEKLESDSQKNPSTYPAQEAPPVLTDPPEQKETLLAIAEEEIIQMTLSLSDNEMQTFPNVSEEYPPEASSTTGPEPKPDVKQEYEDVDATTEEDKWEIRSLVETQACQTSGERKMSFTNQKSLSSRVLTGARLPLAGISAPCRARLHRAVL